jgi:excinuclease ABC subunit B
VYDGTGRDGAEAAVAESIDDVASVIAELEEEMQEASDKLEFERAALLRDQIKALKSGDYKQAGRPASYRQSGKKSRAAKRL